MILDALRFTNSLFLENASKFLIIVFPVFVLQFFVYLAFASLPGNEFGTTTTLFANVQQILTNLLNVYAMALTILLIDDIYKEKRKSISNYFKSDLTH